MTRAVLEINLFTIDSVFLSSLSNCSDTIRRRFYARDNYGDEFVIYRLPNYSAPKHCL